MDLDELRAVQTRERATDGLQDLRDSFYEDVSTYLDTLRETRREVAAEADDPFRSPEVNDLTDEIETAEQVAEAIYERRIGKLLKEASLVASGMSADPDGLTAEERDLYRTIIDQIEENKSLVLDAILGDRDGNAAVGTEIDSRSDRSHGEDGTSEGEPGQIPDRTGGDEDGQPAGTTSSDRTEEADEVDLLEDGSEAASETDEEGSETVERTKVRITEDVGEILGVDSRSYSLRTDDVVDLPVENATPLLEREVAERLE